MTIIQSKNNYLEIAGKKFNSRLFLGTGKFASIDLMKNAINASGTEMVTVALRRVDLDNPGDNLLGAVMERKEDIQLLPNTSGARDADEAVRLSMLARKMGCGNWIKLEVTPDPRYLLPDPIETLKAAEKLVKEGFIVLPYINADPILAKRLEEAGCSTIMPLGSPIGTNKGIKTLDNIKIIIEMSNIPVVVDAGLGLPSHASTALEIGADAVLVNTAIAASNDPVRMAGAFKKSVEAGREAFLAGGSKISETAEASSPLTGFLR
ncbi:MAG: thiazole synthase [Spirochaetes bacterium]|nr:thiazole synthase [Spirochaetota bacterium]